MYQVVAWRGHKAVHIGPGCRRYDLPSSPGSRAWVVEIDAGHQWPHVDQHSDAGEMVFVLSGELIEGQDRIPAGEYVLFAPGSAHQPRTETGVQLFGVNVGEG